MKKHKTDLIVIIALLLIAVISYILIGNIYNTKGNYAEISVDGKVVKTLSLDKDISYDIPLKEHKNTVEIKNGQVFMSEADCPDKLCIKQGTISKNGQSIICLPHKIVVRVISDSDTGVDAHTN